jgi:two-component system nitrate/nitrite response regulator NarL
MLPAGTRTHISQMEEVEDDFGSYLSPVPWYKCAVARSVLDVVVADNHPVYREGVAGAIGRREDMRVVAECADGDQAMAEIAQRKPDVALLDRRMPGLSVIDILDRIGVAGLGTRVLVISAFTDAEGVAAMLEAGAAGYIAKDATREVICAGIRRVADGESVIGHEVQRAVTDHLQAGRAQRRPLLSEREQDVLELLAEGLSAKEIADRLILGTSTIKTHTANIFDKLDVHDRAAAVATAMRRGLLR